MTAIPEDIAMSAWAISARHLTAGQKDVTRMIADGILQERIRCLELAHAALGENADVAIFIEDPHSPW